MLDVYSVALDVCRRVVPLAVKLERCDRDLARQLRRAAASVPLNLAEGFYSQGGNRKARYWNALGSARETLACVEVANAMGYLVDVDERLLDDLDRVVRTVAKLAGYKG